MSQKKVLIITYYWPPAGGPGVQRWLKFCKYLPDNGIEPIVFCPENPSYPITDESLLNEVPQGIKMVKTKIREPYKLAGSLSKKQTKSISSGVIKKAKDQSALEKLMLFIRGNCFIPDARYLWVKPSVNYLKRYVKEHNIDCVVTTGPPHSLHLIGLQLKQLLDINWIADFRDPWTTIGYHKSLRLLPASERKHHRLEREVLANTDHIVVTSNHTKNEFESKTHKPISVITNGFDSHSVRVDTLDQKFSLAHIGSLLSDRNPTVLWQVLGEMVHESSSFKEAFCLNLVGVVSEDIISEIKSHGLTEQLNIVGYVSHDKAIEFQLKSQMLLLIEIDSEDTKAIIPGKLFEYMQSHRPILALGPDNSDVEDMLRTTNTGKYFNYTSKEVLKQYLNSCFEAFQKGELNAYPIGINKFSRQNLTRRLAELLNEYL